MYNERLYSSGNILFIIFYIAIDFFLNLCLVVVAEMQLKDGVDAQCRQTDGDGGPVLDG